jgi:hypothetical protein
MIQDITSEQTSQNQIAGVHNDLILSGKYKKGKTVLDWGGGKYDTTQKIADKTGCDFFIYDPYNRSDSYNLKSLTDVIHKGKADIIVIANVLNVIKEKEWRIKSMEYAKCFLKEDGHVCLSIYNAEKTTKYVEGVGQPTTKGWQMCQPKSFYKEEILSVFDKEQFTLV